VGKTEMSFGSCQPLPKKHTLSLPKGGEVEGTTKMWCFVAEEERAEGIVGNLWRGGQWLWWL